MKMGLLLLSLMASGCSNLLPSFYSPPVRQGNYIDAAMIARLQPGMSKRQVSFILGTPLLSDVFHRNRWDYVYFEDDGGDISGEKRLAVYFNDNGLDRTEWQQ